MRPPPRRTAYFSRARQPGVVFRVSTRAAVEPATWATMAAGEGGDAREALEKIEGHPLAGEDRGHRAGEAGQDRAWRHLLAVVHCRREN